MADVKTKLNDVSVEDFLNRVSNAKRREDAFALLELMKSVTRQPPKMWGPSIVGFDQYRYTYASGREGHICMIGFSPRSSALTLYINAEFDGSKALIKKLGKYTTSGTGGCLYIRKLEDVDLGTLKALISESYRAMKQKHG